jgi:hypothetical protein
MLLRLVGECKHRSTVLNLSARWRRVVRLCLGIRSFLLRLLHVLHSNEDIYVTYLVAFFRADLRLVKVGLNESVLPHLQNIYIAHALQ